MKTTLLLTLSILLLLAACTPAAAPTPTAVPTAVPDRIPPEAEACLITPHDFQLQGLPIPVGLAVNVPGNAGLDLFWRDGSPLGNWPTGLPYASTTIHVAGSIADGVASAPLVFLAGEEDGTSSLKLSLGGEVSTLMEFPIGVLVTALTGIPGSPLIVLSTLVPSADGSLLTSRIFISGYAGIASAPPALETESEGSRYLLPLAVHITADKVTGSDNVIDGLWYTTQLWGIGGDSLTDTRQGLYYLQISSGESLEFLGMGCPFAALATGQDRAAWIDGNALHVTELRSGTTTDFAFLAGNDRAAHVTFSPSGGFVSWLEGHGWQYDNTLETTLRFSTPGAEYMPEFPDEQLAASAGLDGLYGMVPLGWMMPDDEVLLVAVFEAGADTSTLVTVDPDPGILTPLVEGIFAGFAYP